MSSRSDNIHVSPFLRPRLIGAGMATVFPGTAILPGGSELPTTDGTDTDAARILPVLGFGVLVVPFQPALIRAEPFPPPGPVRREVPATCGADVHVLVRTDYIVLPAAHGFPSSHVASKRERPITQNIFDISDIREIFRLF